MWDETQTGVLACMGELFGALVATALVLMAVFVPVAFYPGSIGIIYQHRPRLRSRSRSPRSTRSPSPMLSGLKPRAAPPRGWIWPVAGVIVGLAFGRFSAAAGHWTHALGVVVGGIAGANSLIFRVFNTNFSRLQNGYTRLIRTLVKARRWVMVTLAAGIVLTVLAFTAIPSAFIPDEDQGYLAGFSPERSIISQTERMAGQIAAILKRKMTYSTPM